MGRFLLGFVIGASIGAITVLALTPMSGTETRHSLADRFNAALEAGRQATAIREQELWNEFRQRMKDDQQSATGNQNPPPFTY